MKRRSVGLIAFGLCVAPGCRDVLGLEEPTARPDGAAGQAASKGGQAGTGSGGRGIGALGGSGGAGGPAQSGPSGKAGDSGSGGQGTGGDSPSSDAGAAGSGASNDGTENPTPDAGDSVSSQSFSDVEFTDASCERTGSDGLTCTWTATPIEDEVDLWFPVGPVFGCSEVAYAYDDRGNRHAASSFRFASMAYTSGCGYAAKLVEGVSAPVEYGFTGLSPDAAEVALIAIRPQVATIYQNAAFRRLSLSDPSDERMADGEEKLGAPLGSGAWNQQVTYRYFACTATEGGALDCPVVFTTLDADLTLALPGAQGFGCAAYAKAYDESGNVISATRLDVANETSTGCTFSRLFARAVPTLATFHFESLKSDAAQVKKLEIVGFTVDGTPAELPLGDLPIER